MSNVYRPTWAEINLDHLWHNFEEAQNQNLTKKVIPVIKANAYGHGAIEVMKHLYDQGVRYCAVSLLEEALELRAHFDDIDILMLGPVMENDILVCSLNHIEFTIYDYHVYESVLKFKHSMICHLKVDTGMSRYGFKDVEQISHVVSDLQKQKHVELKGIFTHFATADQDETFFQKQLEQMRLILSNLKKIPPVVHVSNSSSTFKYESKIEFTTHVRLGISLYGLSLDEKKPNIKPVMTLKSKIVQIKELNEGECVGYGATYCATEKQRVAILPIGYADGWIRKNRTGHVQIHNKKFKIVGTICMDACFIQVDETVNVNDTAILFGDLISIDDVAKRLNTINYEVVTQISYRVPRIMIKGDKKND
ncbi:MAG: alanine racemase [Tenericutes bacterium]|nr:alanine racemase [Mycoplasmatota bacterium]